MIYNNIFSKSSLRNKILLSFFLILTISATIIHIVFLNNLNSILTRENLDQTLVNNITSSFTVMSSGVTISAIIAGLFFALFLSNRISSPIRRLKEVMTDIARGRWETRISLSGNDELAQLAQGFNFMAEHIEDALKKLESSKKYTDNILKHIPSIIIVLGRKHNILSSNMSLDKTGKRFSSISPGFFVASLKQEIEESLITGKTVRKETVLSPDGFDGDVIISFTISHIDDIRKYPSKEEKPEILLTITDITESTRMKELVLQSRQDWEDTFNSIPDIITIHDNDFNIIHANRTARGMLGLPELNPGQSVKCYKYFHGTDSPPESCPKNGNNFTAEDQVTHELYEPHLNRYIEIRSIPRVNENGESAGLIHISRDISLRKEIENDHTKLLTAITRAKLEWEMAFDSVSEFILIIDKNLIITRCNSSFADFVGEPVNKIIGRNCYDFFPCRRGQDQSCNEDVTASQYFLEPQELKTKNGRWLYVNHRPIQDESAKSLHFVITAVEITEIKNIQQKLKSSEEALKQKLEDLEKFYDMAIGREIKMKELKKEIRSLNSELSKYANIKP